MDCRAVVGDTEWGEDTSFFYDDRGEDTMVSDTIEEWSDTVTRRRRGTSMGAWAGFGR